MERTIIRRSRSPYRFLPPSLPISAHGSWKPLTAGCRHAAPRCLEIKPGDTRTDRVAKRTSSTSGKSQTDERPSRAVCVIPCLNDEALVPISVEQWKSRIVEQSLHRSRDRFQNSPRRALNEKKEREKKEAKIPEYKLVLIKLLRCSCFLKP